MVTTKTRGVAIARFSLLVGWIMAAAIKARQQMNNARETLTVRGEDIAWSAGRRGLELNLDRMLGGLQVNEGERVMLWRE